ncbi:MAG: GNAT family N-acetyltransferase [Bacteroidota bacterium]
MHIQLEEFDTKGRAFVKENGETKAEMTFSKAGATMLIVDHTDVSEDLRGTGVGKLLLRKIVDLARTHQLKILPLCPFAKSVFDKDATLSDVLR